MAGPQRKQRRPTRVKRVGTAYVTAGELKSKEGNWRSVILPSQGTRKKPLLLVSKEVVTKTNKDTKKTDERIGFIVNEEETKIVEEKEE